MASTKWKISLTTLTAVTACLVLEHFLGIYEPSERTGLRGNWCGMIVLVIGLMLAALRDRALPTLRSFQNLVAMVLSVAAGVSVINFVYFQWIRGGFAGQMAAFTRSTLAARGADPAYVETFAASVEASWTATHILWNTFLLYSVWGFVLAMVSMGTIRLVFRSQRPTSDSPGALGDEE